MIIASVLGGVLLITVIVLITVVVRSVSHLHMHDYSVWIYALYACTGPKIQPATAPLIISDLRRAPRPAALLTLESPTSATLYHWLTAVETRWPWPGCRESHEPQPIRAGTPGPTWKWPQETVSKTLSPVGGTRWACLREPNDPAQSELWNFSNTKSLFLLAALRRPWQCSHTWSESTSEQPLHSESTPEQPIHFIPRPWQPVLQVWQQLILF